MLPATSAPGVATPDAGNRSTDVSFAAAALALVSWAHAAGPVEPAVFVLGLDAVPYEVVAEMVREDGLFDGFHPPVPLISSFPSTTNVALAGMLEPFGVDRSLGYQARFYDRSENRLRGAGPISYRRFLFPWRRFFDHGEIGLMTRLVGKVRPLRHSLQEIEEALDDFLASDEAVYFAWVGATDGAAHLQGPDSLVEILAGLERAVERRRTAHPERPFSVVLFSDHGIAGGEPLSNVRRKARRNVRRAGFRLGKRLGGPEDVVFVDLGMISSFVVYSDPARTADLAGALAETPGVELCVRRRDGGFEVTAAAAVAWFGARQDGDGVEWSYRPEGGDPLGYAGLLQPAAAAAVGEPGWQSDEAWLQASIDSEYPDGLYRLARSFDLVENEASVLCSVADDHMYAARRTAVLARLTVGRLRWTHGSLSRAASLGFLMTDDPRFARDGATRFSRGLAPLARLEASRPSVLTTPEP